MTARAATSRSIRRLAKKGFVASRQRRVAGSQHVMRRSEGVRHTLSRTPFEGPSAGRGHINVGAAPRLFLSGAASAALASQNQKRGLAAAFDCVPRKIEP